MPDRRPEENPCDRSILGLSPKTVKIVNFLGGVIGILGIIIGIAGAYYEFRVVLPNERAFQAKQQQLQLNTTIATLAIQEKAEIASPTIRYILDHPIHSRCYV